ncbi:MAG: OmpH family outer membrane protein [Acidobacteriota bacterium]
MSPSNASVPHRTRILRATLAGLLLLGVANAATAQVSQPAKIAVVDLERVFAESPPGQELRAEVETLQQTVLADIETKTKEAEALRASAVGKSVEEQTQIQRQIEDLDREVRRVRETAQRQISTSEQEKRNGFQELVQPIFAEIQQTQGFDLILNMNRAIVIFAGPRIDITEEIVAKIKAAP